MIAVGSILGMMTTFMNHPAQLRGLGANLLAGTAGALAAGLLVCPGLGLGSLLRAPYTATAMVIVSLGAVCALGLLALARRLRAG
jgi:uncharacterized membrane protein YeaQ/YmgE (transglycosylase-associated protein family)